MSALAHLLTVVIVSLSSPEPRIVYAQAALTVDKTTCETVEASTRAELEAQVETNELGAAVVMTRCAPVPVPASPSDKPTTEESMKKVPPKRGGSA